MVAHVNDEGGFTKTSRSGKEDLITISCFNHLHPSKNVGTIRMWTRSGQKANDSTRYKQGLRALAPGINRA
jgi:hypothetical protein